MGGGTGDAGEPVEPAEPTHVPVAYWRWRRSTSEEWFYGAEPPIAAVYTVQRLYVTNGPEPKAVVKRTKKKTGG